jgi:hypothetical protein
MLETLQLLLNEIEDKFLNPEHHRTLAGPVLPASPDSSTSVLHPSLVLLVPCKLCSSFLHRAFAHALPDVWNVLCILTQLWHYFFRKPFLFLAVLFLF